MKIHKLLACLGLVAALTAPVKDVEGVLASVKSTGMAATAIAYPLDAVCAAFNPAGVTEVGDRLDFGISWDRSDGRATISGNLAPLPGINGTFNGTRTHDIYSPDFGITKQMCFQGYEMTFGFIAYNRNYSKTTYGNVFPLLGTSHLGMEYVHETLAPVWAIKFCDRYSFGLTVNYNVQRLKLNGVENFANPVFSSDPDDVSNRGYSYSTGWGVTLGARAQVLDNLAVGVTYQPRTGMSKFHKYRGFLAQHGKLDIPEKIGAGIAWQVIPCLTAAFDVEFIRWSKVPSIHNSLLPGLFTSELGLADGAGFGWKNQTYYRVGLDWNIDCNWSARVGYRHVNTPIRSSQTAINLLSLETVEDVVTCGGTYRWTDCLEFSAFYAHGFRHTVHGSGSIPLVGFGGGEVDLEKSFNVLGISVGWMY